MASDQQFMVEDALMQYEYNDKPGTFLCDKWESAGGDLLALISSSNVESSMGEFLKGAFWCGLDLLMSSIRAIIHQGNLMPRPIIWYVSDSSQNSTYRYLELGVKGIFLDFWRFERGPLILSSWWRAWNVKRMKLTYTVCMIVVPYGILPLWDVATAWLLQVFWPAFADELLHLSVSLTAAYCALHLKAF